MGRWIRAFEPSAVAPDVEIIFFAHRTGGVTAGAVITKRLAGMIKDFVHANRKDGRQFFAQVVLDGDEDDEGCGLLLVTADEGRDVLESWEWAGVPRTYFWVGEREAEALRQAIV